METMHQIKQIKIEDIKLPNGNNVSDFLLNKACEHVTDEFVLKQLDTNGALIKSIKKVLRPATPAALVGAYVQFAAGKHSQDVLLWPGSRRHTKE